jgi:hypothetical protein
LRCANVPLRVVSRFETALALASSPSRLATSGCAELPRSAANVDGARHSFTSRRPVPRFEARSRTTRNDFMTSDVGRGARAKDPCATTLQKSGTARAPLLAGGPEHPLSSPRVRAWLEWPRMSWRCKPGTTEIFSRAPSREGEGVPKDQGAWNRSVGRGPVKSRLFEPVDRPPPDVAPRGTLPKWRASAGSAFSSRLTLNVWSGD